MKVSYTAVFVYNKDGISVIIPACPGCITCGQSDSQAKDMARDALKSWLEATIFDNRDVPVHNLPIDFTPIKLQHWVKEHKPTWPKYSRWSVKTITVNLEV